MYDLFTFIFKYQPFYFRNGDFSFQWAPGAGQVALLLGAAVAAVFLLYRGQIKRFRGVYGWLLFVARGALVLFAVGLLMRPTLTLPTVASREGVAAILVDNSKSMGIVENGQVRGQVVKDLLAAESAFLRSLRENFRIKQFRFDSSVTFLKDTGELDWSGDQTNLIEGLERVLADAKNLPLSGVILFSDGAASNLRDGDQVLAELQKRGIPVHVVGVGATRVEQDVEMLQVRAPKQLLPDTAAVARVTLRQNGFAGSKGRLEVREGGSLVDSTEVQFPRDTDTTYAELRIYPQAEGIRVYDFRLVPLVGERITQNNSRTALIRVGDSRPRILYVEGKPRWEFKFLRRALSNDRYLRFESLLRTALNKFYRQGIEEETALAGGFPTKKEDLYEYQGILIGNVESAFFSYSQMELLRDFVGRRGGGFLMLGGDSTLSSGGYQNTPVEEMLPIHLEDSRTVSHQRGLAGAELTLYGANHPALELTRNDEENRVLWGRLPELLDCNRVLGLKPGATTLVQLRSSSHAEWNGEPLLVFQRYGRGLAAAFLTGSSWRWQMLQDHEDQSHENFWKQMMRWLVLAAEDPVTVETEKEVYSRGETVSLRAEVRDKTYTQINNAKVEAVVTSSEGKDARLSLRWNSREDGVYFAEWSPQHDGMYQVQLEAYSQSTPPEFLGGARSFFLAATGNREYFDASLKEDYLKHLSVETGGRYYSVADANRLPTEIRYVQSQASVIEVLDLWDMPFNLLLLLFLLFSEWLLRRHLGTL